MGPQTAPIRSAPKTKGPPRRFLFPRSRRLRKRRDFLRVQEKSGRVTTSHFILLVAASPTGAAPARLGIVASRKVGGAAARNRAKRLVREAFRTHPALLPAGVDLVVIARPGAPELSFAAVCREIEGVREPLSRRAREAIRK